MYCWRLNDGLHNKWCDKECSTGIYPGHSSARQTQWGEDLETKWRKKSCAFSIGYGGCERIGPSHKLQEDHQLFRGVWIPRFKISPVTSNVFMPIRKTKYKLIIKIKCISLLELVHKMNLLKLINLLLAHVHCSIIWANYELISLNI